MAPGKIKLAMESTVAPENDGPPTTTSVPVCGIGASAGGIEALNQFFEALAPDLGLAYVVVVHLAPDHKSELPAILARHTTMPVVQVGDHEVAALRANHVYVIGPDRKLVISDTSVGAEPFDQRRGRRMAIDLLFRSLAESRGDGIAVVLSGTGSDGAAGARAVKGHGGLVFVQEPSDAVYPEMPRAIISTGIADVVLPVAQLAQRLAEVMRNKPPTFAVLNPAAAIKPTALDGEERALRELFELLRKRTTHDFSKYKRSTVLRRLYRRIQLSGLYTINDYLAYLRATPSETEALFADFLISVTSFFRDPESWSALQTQVVGPLIEQTDPSEQIRVWIPGCASGEEAYTLAMLFVEEAERRKTALSHLLIFAIDIDERALGIAREGLYPQSIGADVSEARLERFFQREDEHFRAISEIRDRIVFASHDLLRDPPFSRLDLISCRNLLIYLDRDLQQQVMSVLRYALKDQGHLFLGASETVDEELFQTVDSHHRIFATTPRSSLRVVLPELLASPMPRATRYGREPPAPSKATAAELHLQALESAAPPTVLIDYRGNVMHLSPTAARFFQQGGGPPARRLIDLVRPELRDELHALISRALEDLEPHLSTFVTVGFNGSAHHVAMLSQQRPQGKDVHEQLLITFLDAGAISQEPALAPPEPTSELVRELREKLRQAEQRLETMRDEHISINEDLRAANEELQSLNEEYRSTTEELETSKEELQSVNEELQTVNNELKLKLDEVSRAHSDLENLMGATDVATLFLDQDLRIKRFTPKLGEIFNVKARDHERPIGDLTHSLDYPSLEQDARHVLLNPAPIEREVHSRDGRTFVARLSPYRLAGGKEVDGVVITLVDITAMKTAELVLRASEARASSDLKTLHRIQGMSLPIDTAASVPEALDHVLAAAMELQGADRGTVQLLDDDSRQLIMVAQRGFDPKFIEQYHSVRTSDAAPCTQVLRNRATVQIPDVTLDSQFEPCREFATQAGFRAMQSTPLITRSDKPLGVMSIHFRDPHVFGERDRPISELLALCAVDLIESCSRQPAAVAAQPNQPGTSTEPQAAPSSQATSLDTPST